MCNIENAVVNSAGKRIENSVEKEREECDTKFIVQRHGRYNSAVPDVEKILEEKIGEEKMAELDEEEKEKLMRTERTRLTKEEGVGLLTKDKIKEDRITEKGGITETQEMAKKKIKEILEDLQEDEKAEIVFLYSPTTWFGSKEEGKEWEDGFGNRAQHTTEVILDTLASEIKSGTGLGEEIKEKIKIPGIGHKENLEEADIFFLNSAEDPTAYIKALRNKYEGLSWWEEYYNAATELIKLKRLEELEKLDEAGKLKLKEIKELESIRKEIGAESAVDISNRVTRLMKIAAEAYKGNDPKRKLVIWMITHGEDVRSFAQHGAGTKAENYVADYNEGLDIDISPDGKMTTEFRGKEYEVEA